jgi:hypothetical protein
VWGKERKRGERERFIVLPSHFVSAASNINEHFPSIISSCSAKKKRKSWIAKLISFLFNDLHLSCSQSKKINIPVEWFDNHHCVYQILFLKWMKQVFLFTYALMNQNWLIIFSKDSQNSFLLN